MGLLNLYNSLPFPPFSYLSSDILPPNFPNTSTGTPTPTANPGGPIVPFNQQYYSFNTYLNSVVLSPTPSRLANTSNITNLDVENPGVQGGPNADTTTVYPSLVTGTPTLTANPGAAPTRFSQPNTPNNTYLASNPIKGTDSGILYNADPNGNNSLKITNLDTEEPGVDGGIPYKTDKDPTVYPPTTNHVSSIRGWFAQSSEPAKKFNQIYTSQDTYSEFIALYTL